MILWDENDQYDRRIIFLSTDMNRVFLNIEVPTPPYIRG